MKKLFMTGLAFFLLLLSAQSQNTAALSGNENTKVKWYTIQEAEVLTKQEPRKIFIDVFTDWCGWCKRLDKDTFSNPVIAEILNTEFYPVKFNAESREPVTFAGYEFKNSGPASRGTHQLAAALLQGKMSYPSAAYMNEKLELLFAVPGYFSAKDLEPLLQFIASDSYKTTRFEIYKTSFQGKVK